jgi:hypothetical protein
MSDTKGPRKKEYKSKEPMIPPPPRQNDDGLVIKNRLLEQQLEILRKRNKVLEDLSAPGSAVTIKNLETEVRKLKQQQLCGSQKLVANQDRINTDLCQEVEHFRNLCQEQSEQVQKLENLIEKLTALNNIQEGNYKKDNRIKKQQIELLTDEKSRLENRFRALMSNQNCFRF